MDIAILLGTLFVLFAIGVPIAFALGLAAIAGASWIGMPLEAVMLKVSDGVNKFSMLAIPFFVLAGAIMAEGGMAQAAGRVRQRARRRCIRGGLVAGQHPRLDVPSGISGSSVADTSSIGSVMIPQMEKDGYPRAFATNVTISGSVQAILIPPSHNAVIYSLAAGGLGLDHQPFHGGRDPGPAARPRR